MQSLVVTMPQARHWPSTGSLGGHLGSLPSVVASAQLQGSKCSPKQDPFLHLGNAKACWSPPPNSPRPSTQRKILCPEVTDG